MNPAPLTAARLYKRLLGYATPYWRVFTLAVLAMLGFAATDTGFAALMKPMLDGNFIEHDPQLGLDRVGKPLPFAFGVEAGRIV